MSKQKKKKKKNVGGRPPLVDGDRSESFTVSMAESEAKIFLAFADKYDGGNCSAFIRRLHQAVLLNQNDFFRYAHKAMQEKLEETERRTKTRMARIYARLTEKRGNEKKILELKERLLERGLSPKIIAKKLKRAAEKFESDAPEAVDVGGRPTLVVGEEIVRIPCSMATQEIGQLQEMADQSVKRPSNVRGNKSELIRLMYGFWKLSMEKFLVADEDDQIAS